MLHKLNSQLVQFIAFTDRQLDIYIGNTVFIVNGDNESMDKLQNHIIQKSTSDEPWILIPDGFRIFTLEEFNQKFGKK